MRKEATLEQWENLYDIAVKIKELKPWEYFCDMDIITISLPNFNEPFYCNIIGKIGQQFAISTYAGFEAMNDFYKIADNLEIPKEQLIRYQNNMICFFGNRDELSYKELKIIKELGLKFCGKNNYIYFKSFKPGYFPYILDRNEVLQLTKVFKQLFMVLFEYIEKKIKVNFKRGNTLFRKYDKNKKMWINIETPMFLPVAEYSIPVIQDELLIARLNKKKITKENIEIDILYLGGVIDDKKFDRPIIPKLCVLADCATGMIIERDMLTPKDNDIQKVLCAISNYIVQLGKPKTVFVRDEYMKSILTDLCKKINVNLKIKGNLKAIDDFMNDFNKR